MELSRPRKYAATREDVLVEQTLVEKAQEGVAWAVGKLYEDHILQVRKLLLSMLGPCDQVDDLAQDVFVQVFSSLHKFRGDSRFSTWIHRVTVNVTLSWMRKRKNQPHLTEQTDILLSDATQERQTRVQTQLRELYIVLDSLSPKRRIAFALFEIEQRSLDEIAAITGSNIATVKSRLFLARREIRKKAETRPVLLELMEHSAGGESQ